MLNRSKLNSMDCSTVSHSTPFHAKTIPAISISNYVTRILRYAPCSGECFVTALIYMNRALTKLGPRFLDQSTVHRLLISSVLLSSKFLDDLYYNNTFYAKVGGISPHEMNALELEMLHVIGFQLHVDRAEYISFASLLWSEYQVSFPAAPLPTPPVVTFAPLVKSPVSTDPILFDSFRRPLIRCE